MGGSMAMKLPGLGRTTITGYSMQEVGALGVGGAFYGAVNAFLPRLPLVGQLQAALMRVPVVGTALTPFLFGATLNVIANKFNVPFKQQVKLLGDGLVGAAVVGMGVNASQFVPFLSPAPAMSGVDYTPGPGLFGGTPDFGGVDYTPDLAGVDFTPGAAYQSEYYQTEGAHADFGGVPEGLS